MSSDGDLVSEERARQLAWETARVLRELERQFADPHNQDDVLPGDFRSMLDSYLQTATELLGTKHPMMSLITNLRAHLVTDHELTLGAVKTRSALMMPGHAPRGTSQHSPAKWLSCDSRCVMTCALEKPWLPLS